MNSTVVLCLSVCAVGLTTTAMADENQALTKEEFAALFQNVDVSAVKDAPLSGLYEIVIGSSVSYVSKDARFLIRGEIIDLGTSQNLTEATLAEARSGLLAAIDPATEIVFSPQDGNVKHRVTVFTDVDCGYCREFHRHIAEVNALGIEVRYVSFPRTGPDTESWHKAEGVWCAADPHAALTQAKLGADVVPVPSCTASAVAADYALGQSVGLSGTPAIYSESGFELGGYLPPAELLAALEKLAARP